ncbi:MAG: glycosyltransferase family 39 protein [Candidatus Shapirobacteria bacterium]|nr:glycosyltransferase family 39 protein [Candidatus Shapirobacteria bacterium]
MKSKILLILIIILGVFSRLINLGSLPNAYSPDELAQGYTAYSIIQTGKDEWGSKNLFNLQSFGDYKPPVQTLLMIPSIKIFGLTPFAVRLPNAIFSILTILLTYCITKLVFNNSKIALLSSLFICLSPWSLPMSRIALEANLIVFIISLATYLFLISQKKQNIFLLLISILIFGISLFTYHSAKIFTPLFLILLIIHQKTYLKPKFFITSIFVFSLFFISNFYINSQIKSNRTGDIAIFNPTDHWSYVSNTQYEITQNGLPYFFTKLFYNKIVYLSETFIQSYLSYFSPQFLITQGAGETTYGMLPGFGVLGLIPGLGFIFSLIFLIQKKSLESKRDLLFILFVILIPPLIAAIAKGQYSANRVSLMMPFIQIFSAFGLITFLSEIKKYQKTIYLSLSLIFTFTTLTFLQRYFFQGNQVLAEGMLYGHQQANEYLKNITASHIIYSRKLSEPQAYVSFFNQTNPQVIQSESINWSEYQKRNLSFLDQLGEYKLENFIFREINIPSDSQLPNTLIIGRPEEFRDVKPDHIIYYPSKSELKPAIYIYQTKI